MGVESVAGQYRHDQSSSSTTWTITHSLGTSTPVVDCWVDVSGTMTKIIPLSVEATSDSVVTITFSSAYAGRALVA